MVVLDNLVAVAFILEFKGAGLLVQRGGYLQRELGPAARDPII